MKNNFRFPFFYMLEPIW